MEEKSLKVAQKAYDRLNPFMCRDDHDTALPAAIEAYLTSLPSGGDVGALNERDEMRATQAALYDAIAHGDEIHRAWLKEAIAAHFAGRPIPPPRSDNG